MDPTDAALAPASRADADDGASTVTASTSLPAYSLPPSPDIPRASRTFTYELTTKKGPRRAWATLTVASAHDTPRPTLFEGETLTGTFALDLARPDRIHAITISVTGRVVHGAGAGEDFVFLDIALPLWARAMGDPRAPASTVPAAPAAPAPFDAKLEGAYSWPFALALPACVTLEHGRPKTPQPFRLPHALAERHTRAGVVYAVAAVVARGKLRGASRLEAPLVYVPRTRPDPPSAMRARAYAHGGAIPGPDVDPDGWHARTVPVRGTLAGARPADLRCTFSLATPLCYPRGTAIPCSLCLAGDDAAAIALLAAPNAVFARLRRTVRCRPGRARDDLAPWADDVLDGALATWWPASAAGGAHRRILSGELHLAPDLQPSSALAHFAVEYAVVLFPFDAVGFVAADAEPLAVVPVEIATANAEGPRPRAYAPPEYEDVPSASSNSYFARRL